MLSTVLFWFFILSFSLLCNNIRKKNLKLKWFYYICGTHTDQNGRLMLCVSYNVWQTTVILSTILNQKGTWLVWSLCAVDKAEKKNGKRSFILHCQLSPLLQDVLGLVIPCGSIRVWGFFLMSIWTSWFFSLKWLLIWEVQKSWGFKRCYY